MSEPVPPYREWSQEKLAEEAAMLRAALHSLSSEAVTTYRELDKLKQYEAKRREMVNFFEGLRIE